MKYRGVSILTAALVAGVGTQAAQARGGQAAYHLSTSAMVTAARYEPIGSVLRVTNPRNGRSVVVVVNDRGPFNGGRVLDLSTGAFRQLFGGLGRGVGYINYEVISSGKGGYALTSRGSARRSRRNRGRHRGWSHSRHRRSRRSRR